MLERLFTQAGGEGNIDNSPLFKFFNNVDIETEDVYASENNALNFDTVYACVNVLSDDMAKLPFKTYQKSKDGAITEIFDNDVHKVIRIRPNEYMTPFNFIKLLMTDVLIHGNAYGLIVRNGQTGKIREILPLTSTETHPIMDKGKLYYMTNIEGKNVYFHSDEVLHIKGMSMDGITGLSPIQTIRIQLESNEHASRFNRDMIKKDGTPKGILEVDTSLSPEARNKVRESWEEANKGETIAVADNGIKYKQLGLSQSDMQWLQSQKYNAQRIASIFKVPLHKINDLENATYTNIEHQSLDYIKNTLQPWVTQIEHELGYKFYTPSEAQSGYYLKFNMDSELRGDSHARAQVNEINARNGFKTVNEIRGSNEDSPYPEEFANKPFMTLNNAPMENIVAYNDDHFSKKVNDPTGGQKDKEVDDE